LGRYVFAAGLVSLGVALLSAVVGCAAATSPPPSASSSLPGPKRPAAPAWEGAGLRVVLSNEARSVCVSEQGCPAGPMGAISVKPLEPPLRAAISDALLAAGFQVVSGEAERDMLADVEWRGTDTIALKLEDTHGRLIDQASYQRSLSRCRQLPDLTWNTCWAANFEAMKSELVKPLQRSAALISFARRRRVPEISQPGAPVSSNSPSTEETHSAPASRLPERLDGALLEQTVASHRDEVQRSCFQPAFDARAEAASSSARVGTTLTIEPGGRVRTIATSGDPPGYLHLASCIAEHVRTWRFPAAQRETTASIPFIFAADTY